MAKLRYNKNTEVRLVRLNKEHIDGEVSGVRQGACCCNGGLQEESHFPMESEFVRESRTKGFLELLVGHCQCEVVVPEAA